jgi:hypothetical protein
VKHKSNSAYVVPIIAGVVGMCLGGPAMGLGGVLLMWLVFMPIAAIAAFRDNAEEHHVNSKAEMQMYEKLKRKGF